MILTMHKTQFTTVVSCGDELAIHSRPLLCLQRQVANLPADCSAVDLYCVTITSQEIFKCSVQAVVVGVLPHVTVERRRLGR